jgi:sortase A
MATQHEALLMSQVAMDAMGVECALPAGYPARRVVRTGPRHAIRARYVSALLALCIGAGLWQLGQGFYIHAKARLAQILIADAWSKILAGQRAVKPWPWADTWPVARLSAPAAGEAVYILAGANGRAIAFGPGHMYGTPLPGEDGNSVIGGHRDTHFAFLQHLKNGDALNVQREDGIVRRYRVSETRVVDKGDLAVASRSGPTRLTLVTCWPFDAVRAGGPERYVVTAAATDP